MYPLGNCTWLLNEYCPCKSALMSQFVDLNSFSIWSQIKVLIGIYKYPNDVIAKDLKTEDNFLKKKKMANGLIRIEKILKCEKKESFRNDCPFRIIFY